MTYSFINRVNKTQYTNRDKLKTDKLQYNPINSYSIDSSL